MFRFRFLLIALFSATTLLAPTKYIFAQVQKTALSGIVKGTVTLDGKPEAGVTVVLAKCYGRVPANYPSPVAATTDEDGNFQFDSVAAGNYCISAYAPMLAHNYGDGNKQLMLSVSAGEKVEGVTLSLSRGGVITGKIIGPDGRPLINHYIHVYCQKDDRYFSKTGTSDDRGIYRIYGIPAGDCKVSWDPDDADDPFGLHRHRQSDHLQSKQVEVVAGHELTDVDFISPKTPDTDTFKVSGSIIDGGTGLPISNARLTCRQSGPGRGPFKDLSSAPSDEKGGFSINGLVPGHYSLHLGFNDGLDYYSDDQLFDIKDSDTDGLVIKALPSGSVSGFVSLDNTSDPAIIAKLFQLSLFAEGRDSAARAPVRINPDGSFRIEGLAPGWYSIEPHGLSRQFSHQRTDVNGESVEFQFELKPGAALNGVRLIFSYTNGTIRGTIVPAGFQIPSETYILVSIDQLDAPKPAQVGISTPDPQFTATELPPGRYKVSARVIFRNSENVKIEYTSKEQIVEVANDSDVVVNLTLTAKRVQENKEPK